MQEKSSLKLYKNIIIKRTLKNEIMHTVYYINISQAGPSARLLLLW